MPKMPSFKPKAGRPAQAPKRFAAPQRSAGPQRPAAKAGQGKPWGGPSNRPQAQQRKSFAPAQPQRSMPQVARTHPQIDRHFAPQPNPGQAQAQSQWDNQKPWLMSGVVSNTFNAAEALRGRGDYWV